MKNELTKAFADLNAKMLERQMNWALGRREAVATFRNSDEAKAMRAQKWGSDLVSRKSIEIAGGKGWLEVISNGETYLKNFVTKNIAAMIEKRDETIIKALTKAGVTSIPDFELVECSDGFEGTFNVAGHIVTIRTILAGGYNIQCLHNRTLVKVK